MKNIEKVMKEQRKSTGIDWMFPEDIAEEFVRRRLENMAILSQEGSSEQKYCLISLAVDIEIIDSIAMWNTKGSVYGPIDVHAALQCSALENKELPIIFLDATDVEDVWLHGVNSNIIISANLAYQYFPVLMRGCGDDYPE